MIICSLHSATALVLLVTIVSGCAVSPDGARGHTEVTVDPNLFDGYVGYYQLAPTVFDSITRKGNHLYTRLSNEGAVELLPKSDRDYFLKDSEGEVTFLTDAQGHATEIVVRQHGHEWHAKRANEAAAKAAERNQDQEFERRSPTLPANQGMMN